MNDVPEGAYPFTTIDPSVGEAYVRVECAAPEFDHSCTPNAGYCEGGTRFVPIRLVDVAGLVPGARTPQDDGTFLQDCFVLEGGATAEEFAYFLHTDIGDGFLHAHDVRSERQVGADRELDHRDVVEITTTN